MFTCISCAIAQNSSLIHGTIIQDGTKARVERVEVRNYRSGQLTYSNKLGLFDLNCKIGDTLQFERIGYLPQKVAVKAFSNFVIYLRITNQLKEVAITGQSVSQTFKEASRAISKERGIFYEGKPPLALLSPFGGRPLTFFYELLSKDGRRVRRLNQLAANAAEAEEIDRHFNDLIIQQVVPIDSANLEAFKLRYTPKLIDLRKWSGYERSSYIKRSFEEYHKK
ncbi:MAG: hypothetical protein V4687_15000 [Bacteroidota bacterium]